METNKELMRAEFEAWLQKEWPAFIIDYAPSLGFYKGDDGRQIGDMWDAWQAALSQRSEAVDAYVPGHWFDARTIDEMQEFYLSRLPVIREAAKEHGYAIGVHGSMRRDFDLMAMQWRDDASDIDSLARAIADAACGIRREGSYDWEKKPNGRVATSIPVAWPQFCWTSHENPDFDNMISAGHIDLSIIASTASAPSTAAGEQVPNNSGEKPAGFDVCPISGRKFWGNIDHPERGRLATYGGPFDTYSIPYLDDDNELRVERFDQDSGEWVEGGEPFGWYYDEQQPEFSATQPTPAQGDAGPVATKCAACNGEGWVRDIHDMEQGRIRCTKCATRQSSADAVDAALALAREALTYLAAFNDSGANSHLKLFGSYNMFDEPNAVHTARTTLLRMDAAEAELQVLSIPTVNLKGTSE